VAALFKPVQKPQKCPPGVDPKSVLCIYFNSGKCTHGLKCMFSHDPNIERKSEKIDLYTDMRERNMSEWDDATLTEIVNQKNIGKPNNPTAGICNHFLKAVEELKYGWFWQCPNGDKCQYRHALPPGFVFKPKKVEETDKEDQPSLEDVLEEQRNKITGGVPITTEAFNAWKEKLKAQKMENMKKDAESRNQELRAGRIRKTGREILTEYSTAGKLKEEEDDGDAVDLTLMIKEKQVEEEAVDLENIQLAAKLAKEAEEITADITEDKLVTEAEAEEKERKQREQATLTTTSPENMPEQQLQGVDQSLFTEDADEDLPEDDDELEEIADEEVEENVEDEYNEENGEEKNEEKKDEE